MHVVEVVDGQPVWTEVPDLQPLAGRVLLRVEATSVNRADILQRKGFYPPPPGASPILGLEAAGTVLSGAGPWKPGDRVMALLQGGGYAEQVSVDPRHVLPVPKAVGLPAAGGLLEVFVTAYLNLVELGRLTTGERVLIHGGSGGVGTAAIQLASALGAEVWTTASEAKLVRCRELGATRALDYRKDAFSGELQDAGGAQLILDCLGAKYLEPNLEALAPDGRLVIIGLQKGARAEIDLGRLLTRRLQLIGSTLRALPPERKADVLGRFQHLVLPLFDAGRLQVVIDRQVPLREAARAHAALEAGEQVGKILLVP